MTQNPAFSTFKKKKKKGIESVSYAKIKKGYFVYGVILCWLEKEVDWLESSRMSFSDARGKCLKKKKKEEKVRRVKTLLSCALKLN